MSTGDDPPEAGSGALPPTTPPPGEPPRTVVVRIGEERPPGRLAGLPRWAIPAAIGVVAVLVVLVLVAVLVLPRASGGRHADGDGILASNGTSGFHNSYGRDRHSTGPVTGAIRLCLQRGTEPAIIESIGPDEVVGSSWRLLGASVRVFTPSEGHSPIISMDGYPPALPDTLQPAVGFGVTTPCGDVASGVAYTELLIGLEPTDPAGGGWDGIDVTYRVGGTESVLVVGQAFVQCGTAPLPDYCPAS
jgi:hypothetical protein